MAAALHSQAVVTLEEASAYLQDNGAAVENPDLLIQHINGIMALMRMVTGRKYLKHVSGDTITELRDGRGNAEIWTKEAPIQTLTTVTLYPYRSGETEITGPGTTAYNDSLWYNKSEGLITLKSQVFPDENSGALITYEAGFDTDDLEYMGLKMMALDALASRWARFKNQKHGVSSESRGEYQVTYSENDFNANAMKDMRRMRRTMFA